MKTSLSLLLVSSALAGCLLVQSEDGSGGSGGSGNSNAGGSGQGGEVTTGGQTNGSGGKAEGGAANGGAPAGGNGSGGAVNGSGGASDGGGGAAPECLDSGDCPLPEFQCSDPACDQGVCGEVFSAEGSECTEGFCDGAGYCVECLDNTDCGQGELCDTDMGQCYSETLGGACGDNLCQLGAADNACVACMINANANGGDCDSEYDACLADVGGAGCVTCSEYFQGGSGDFCQGSLEPTQALLDCYCTVGVCAK